MLFPSLATKILCLYSNLLFRNALSSVPSTLSCYYFIYLFECDQLVSDMIFSQFNEFFNKPPLSRQFWSFYSARIRKKVEIAEVFFSSEVIYLRCVYGGCKNALKLILCCRWPHTDSVNYIPSDSSLCVQQIQKIEDTENIIDDKTIGEN